MNKNKITLAGIVCLALLLMPIQLFNFTSSQVMAQSTQLVVNANQTLRPVTYVATGSLYGLASGTVPSLNLIQPIKPNTFMQKAVGGTQQPTGDVLAVAPLAAASGAKLVVRMIDYYPGWPYQFNPNNWMSVVDNQIAQIKASQYYNIISAYAPFNEPDNTWNTANGTFNDIWVQTYRRIRQNDPTKPIQGPSFSDNISGNSRAPSMQAFLQHAVATNTVPDIIEWHELIRSSKIEGDVNTVRQIMQNLGISPRPFSISEYAAPAEVGIPGPLVGYIAKFERLGIRDAELPFWNQSGTLGDLLTSSGGNPNAAYWLYKWYGEMSGNMVVTTPPAQTGIDGFASVPSGNNQVSIIVGGCSGSCSVRVNGLNALNLGTTVNVRLDQTVSMGRTVAVSGPSTISTTTYTPSNGTITVPITMNANNAYRITITSTGTTPTNTPMPGGNGSPYNGTAVSLPGTVQAENYNTGGEGVAYHDNEAANQGGQYRTGEGVDVETTPDTGGGYDVGYTVAGEWMKYTVNVTTSGTYSLNFRVASQQTGGSFHLEVDGVNVTGAMTMPNTGGWQTWTTVTRTGVNLTAGQRVLRLVIDGSNGNFNWFSVSGGTAPTNTPGSGGFPVPGTYYRLINRNSGKVADVASCGTGDGVNIRQWPSLGNACQQWSFVATSGGYYKIVNRNSGKLLDVANASTADGANVHQWSDVGVIAQQWSVNNLGNGYYYLLNRNSGKALDVNGCSTADGGNIQQWTWLNNNCQQWQIVP